MKNVILLFALLGLLFGCNGNSATVRFKAIAVFEIDGEIREFANVMQVEYTRYENSSGLGYGGNSKTWGEAMVIDLNERGKAYMLWSRYANRQYFSVYDSGILKTFDVDASTGNLKQEHLEKLKSLKGRKKLTNLNHKGRDVQPSFISFRDETNPNSVFLVENEEFDLHFGAGIRFLRVDIEISDEPVTDGVLVRHLPWLAKKFDAGFERIPPGADRPESTSDWPLRWFVNYNIFYAAGSR